MTIDAEAREELIDQLQDYPGRMQQLLEDASLEDLERAGPGGAWGGVETLCHLRDVEELFLERLERMLEEDDPDLPVVEDSLWPIQRDYLNQDPFEAFEDFVDYRRQVVDLLLELNSRAWSRSGRHSQFGKTTVRDFVERVIARDKEHERLLRAALNQEA